PSRHLLTTPDLVDAPASPQIHTLSLHDALPIYNNLVAGKLKTSSYAAYAQHLKNFNTTVGGVAAISPINEPNINVNYESMELTADRKSTRLNSSHVKISYAVFCLKKKKEWCDSV